MMIPPVVPVKQVCLTEEDFVIVVRTFPQPFRLMRIANSCYKRVLGIFKKQIVDRELLGIKDHEEIGHAHIAVDQLLNTHGKFYSSTVVYQYLSIVQNKSKGEFIFSSLGICYDHSANQQSPFAVALTMDQDILPQTKIAAIPYNLTQHHVIILLDFQRNRVEYFDPLGFEPNHVVTRSRHSTNMQEELERIRDHFFYEGEIIVNHTPHQQCACCCAIISLFYTDRRLSGLDAEQIHDAAFTESQVDSFRINTLVQTIKEEALGRCIQEP